MTDNKTILEIPRPRGEIAKRTLQFFWIADISGSMHGDKIQSLNWSVREAIAAVSSAVKKFPAIEVEMRAIKFSSEADWHVGPSPVPLKDFRWPELAASSSTTSTSKAVQMLADELSIEKIGRRSVPPVCILLSDGYCTDPEHALPAAIQALDDQPWGRRAVRLSIAIGKEGEYSESELSSFISPYLRKEVSVLKAETPKSLLRWLRWASVQATIASSQSRARNSDGVLSPIILPSVPDIDEGEPQGSSPVTNPNPSVSLDEPF